ncbi:MAG: DUF455 family protein [Methylococcaceae bacterium]|nr:DUF455 family protein [Methylococcaceae bacterium]
MDNIFIFAKSCLQKVDIDEKLTLTHKAWALCQQNKLSFESSSPVQAISETRFPVSPQLLPAHKTPKRGFGSPAGIAALFHSLAHIEFVAIYLAWDIIYRFRGLPEQFYKDWLQVADEEAQHFALIRKHLLDNYGTDYGDLAAHKGLWEHAEDTAHDVLARLALVPRCMEARGLDATPMMIEKFKNKGDEVSVAILTRILDDEVGHVAFGSFWFKTLCEQQGFNAEDKYKELIIKYFKGKPKGPFNKEMRIIAGFSDSELDWLEHR